MTNCCEGTEHSSVLEYDAVYIGIYVEYGPEFLEPGCSGFRPFVTSAGNSNETTWLVIRLHLSTSHCAVTVAQAGSVFTT